MEDLQKKLLVGLAWGQEARMKLATDLEVLNKENKTIAQRVSRRLKEWFSVPAGSIHEADIRKQHLTGLVTNLNTALMKAKNQEAQYKMNTKKKLINAIKITGVKGVSEEEIDERIGNDNIDS